MNRVTSCLLVFLTVLGLIGGVAAATQNGNMVSEESTVDNAVITNSGELFSVYVPLTPAFWNSKPSYNKKYIQYLGTLPTDRVGVVCHVFKAKKTGQTQITFPTQDKEQAPTNINFNVQIKQNK